jgi:membrane protease YdiL (CAAX protease family)
LLFGLIWLLCVLAFAGLALLVGSLRYGTEVIGAGADAVDLPGGMEWLRIGQLINQFGFFIFPSLIFPLIYYGRNGMTGGLGLGTSSPAKVWLAAILLMVAALPLVNALISWNAALDLPSQLAGLESWMREQEDQATRLTSAFLEDASVQGLLWNALIMALIPGIGEELLFRANLQPLFIRWTGNRHAGVILAAFIFSAMHLQFYGFFPRALLGLLLGYAFLWTKNLWIPVLMHTLNNLAVVLYSWLSARGTVDAAPEDISAFEPGWALISGSLLLLAALFYLHRESVSATSSN